MHPVTILCVAALVCAFGAAACEQRYRKTAWAFFTTCGLTIVAVVFVAGTFYPEQLIARFGYRFANLALLFLLGGGLVILAVCAVMGGLWVWSWRYSLPVLIDTERFRLLGGEGRPVMRRSVRISMEDLARRGLKRIVRTKRTNNSGS